MGPERLPLTKLIDTPFISLDETNIEMFSVLFLFIAVILISGLSRRRQLLRHIVQVVSIFVFFFLVYSCLGVFGLVRNGLYGLTLLGTAYTESFYWMALPVVIIASTLVAGPIFCGWICPTGTIQEAASWLRRRVLGPRRQVTRRQLILLGLATTTFFSAVVWLSLRQKLFIEDSSLHWGGALLLVCYLVVIGLIDDLPSRTLRIVSLLAIVVTAASHLSVTSPVHFAFTARNDPASALATLVIAFASLVVTRSWCRYLCPWGYVLGFLNRFSRLKLVAVEGRCTACRTCAQVCDVAAVEQGQVRTELCQLCYACVDACPGRAIEVVNVWQTPADATAAEGPAAAAGAAAGNASAER